jgi:apolipoprotein N-acyltransferase
MNFINKIIVSEYRFKYFIFSAVSGILLALSFQKINFFWLAWIAFIPLIYCILKNNFLNSVLYSFIAGFVFNFIAAYWMFPFLLNNAGAVKDSLIVSFCAWLYLSLYFVVWAASVNFIKKYFQTMTVVLFASCFWVILEFIRTYIFTGLPWNLIGYSQASFLYIIQFADITGVYGLSFAVILINMLLCYFICSGLKKYFFYAVFIFVFLLSYGFWRIGFFPQGAVQEITVAVAQPNIAQYKKWDRHYKDNIIKNLYSSSEFFKQPDIDLLVYPETVLPRRLEEDEEIQKLVHEISSNAVLTLIGGMSIEKDKIYNTVFLVSKDGVTIDKYKKNHLVIFGEYLPFRFVLSKLLTTLNATGDISNGKEIKVFEFKKYTLGISVCSENFFPYFSRKLVLKGANVLTNHTNDAWFGDMAAPYQHFVMNIFRAVENRKNVIVSANTGISAVIDSKGRVAAKTKTGSKTGFISHVYTNNYLTVYDKIGDFFVHICLLYAAYFFILAILSVKKKKNS